jgi:hypothetical protein
LLKRFIFLLVILTACSTFFKKKTERILAKASSEYLYESDLKGMIPPHTPARDSIVIVKGFIDNWVRQKLLIAKAMKNLSADQMDFSKQLEDYKNSLIVYEYENALVRQKLDTVVTEDETENYYDSNQKNFLLKDNIVQIQYVKLPVRSARLNSIRKLLYSDKSEDKENLASECEKYASNFFLDDQAWLLFNDILKEIPVKTYNQEDFLKNHRDVELRDSMFVYLVRFRDFKIKDGISPLTFEKERIRNIILNKRKIDLINKMHEDTYQQALKHNEFEVY